MGIKWRLIYLSELYIYVYSIHNKPATAINNVKVWYHACIYPTFYKTNIEVHASSNLRNIIIYIKFYVNYRYYDNLLFQLDITNC